MPDVDVVVIGSGPGGLAAALTLARQGLLVLVLEQHYLPGGYSHSFPLGGHLWSPGVHYVGELGPGGAARRFFEAMGVGEDLAFVELDPEAYDVVLLPDGRRMAYATGFDRTAERFAEAFPAEAGGVRAWFEALRAIAGREGGAAALAGAPLSRLLDRHARDPALRALLVAQSGNYGLPPSRAPAGLHADVCHHYAEGGGYPVGGGRAIARAFLRGLRREGGEIQMRARVVEILTEPGPSGRRVAGVRLESGAVITAGAVVSNADPDVTFRKLVGGAALSEGLRRGLERAPWSMSCLSLFVTARVDPARHGLGASNYWVVNEPDPERAYDLGDLGALTRLPYGMVSIPDLKDPSGGRRAEARRADLLGVEAFALVPYAPFAPWAGTLHGARPAAYEALKRHLTERMLALVERVVPDIRQGVEFLALGTPLTNQHFVAATRGALYGVERAVDQPTAQGLDATTEIAGLYLCGASTSSHGIFGAGRSGVEAAAALLGVDAGELMQAPGPPLQVRPAPRPGSAP